MLIEKEKFAERVPFTMAACCASFAFSAGIIGLLMIIIGIVYIVLKMI